MINEWNCQPSKNPISHYKIRAIICIAFPILFLWQIKNQRIILTVNRVNNKINARTLNVMFCFAYREIAKLETLPYVPLSVRAETSTYTLFAMEFFISSFGSSLVGRTKIY